MGEFMADITNLTDECLLEAARRDENRKDGVMSELITRYVNIIVKKANKMAGASCRLNRQDAEDFISEGFLGLLSAIRAYDGSKGGFMPYANICIDNRMKSALGKARRTLIFSEDFDAALIKEKSPGADEVLIEKESGEEILKRIKKILSEREYKVFDMYLNSYSYRQIGESMGISVKSVDNALTRARTKLKSANIY